MECPGQHQGEEAAAAREKGNRRDRDRVAAEGRNGERGGGGEGQRQDAERETQGTEQRGAEMKKGETVGKGVSWGVPQQLDAQLREP